MVENHDRMSLLTDPTTHKFRNVRDKIRNNKLSNETAWREAQPLFAECDPEYPEKYNPHLNFLKTVFSLRRGAYLKTIGSKEASQQIKDLVNNLSQDDRELVSRFVISIRDFFDITPQLPKRSFR